MREHLTATSFDSLQLVRMELVTSTSLPSRQRLFESKTDTQSKNGTHLERVGRQWVGTPVPYTEVAVPHE